jgi:hypothetical protein
VEVACDIQGDAMTIEEVMSELSKYPPHWHVVLATHSAASLEEQGADPSDTTSYSTRIEVSGEGQDETSEMVYIDVWGAVPVTHTPSEPQ